jgi:hypothetical protein
MILSNENLEPSLGASSRYYLMKIQHCQGLLIIYGEGARARKKSLDNEKELILLPVHFEFARNQVGSKSEPQSKRQIVQFNFIQ